jgi:uncharacterized protein (UPF0332 family)
MSLEDWKTDKWIHAHVTSAQEIQELLKSADEDLRNARLKDVSPAWSLSMAYTAALRYARAALFSAGYRPGREREHERTIESLRYTVNPKDPDTIRLLHSIRKKRHAATYDSLDSVTEPEAKAAVKAASDLGNEVKLWLKNEHPDLLK